MYFLTDDVTLYVYSIFIIVMSFYVPNVSNIYFLNFIKMQNVPLMWKLCMNHAAFFHKFQLLFFFIFHFFYSMLVILEQNQQKFCSQNRYGDSGDYNHNL